jgi:hypothetical protein
MPNFIKTTGRGLTQLKPNSIRSAGVATGVLVLANKTPLEPKPIFDEF